MTELNHHHGASREPFVAPSPEALAGWCEAASRMLRPLLESPQVKARVRILFGHVDPDYAPVLVRTLWGTDPELPLAALATLPRLLNVLIEAAAELTRAVGAYPHALLGAVVAGLVAELRPRPLGEALGRAVRMARDLPRGGGDPAAFWAALAAGFSAGFASPSPGLAPGAREGDLTRRHVDPSSGLAPRARQGDPAEDRGAGSAPGALAAHAQGLADALASLLASHPELATSLARAIEEAFARQPALLQQGLVPLLAPLHDALHRQAAGEEAPR